MVVGAKLASRADYWVEVTMPTEGQTHQEAPRDPHDENRIITWIPLVIPLIPVVVALVAYFVKSTVL